MDHLKEPSEFIVCDDCGAEFNLAAQHYYGPLCPDCTSGVQTWPSCVACSARIEPGSVETAVSHGRTGTERVPVCSAGCKDHIETSRHAPRGPDLDKGEDPYGERVTKERYKELMNDG